MGGMNLDNLGANVGHGVDFGGGVEVQAPVTHSAGNETAQPAPVLGGENVTIVERSAMEQLVMQSAYETAENTISNLCDTPEERAAKAEREQEAREKEDREAYIDKEVQTREMNDEISAKKEEKV